MAMEIIDHIPVLLEEMISALQPNNNGLYVDATFGAGGYSRALLNSSSELKVIGLDRDLSIKPYAQKLIDEYGNRFQFVHGCFGEVAQLLNDQGINQVDGLVLDLGVSSMQIDSPERGFSFKEDGPLDMRMGLAGLDAKTVVNGYSERQLSDIIFRLGDERKARSIAKAIVSRRGEKPFTTTRDLATVVAQVVGFERPGFDPATRTFQAIRMFVNDELGQLESVLAQSSRLLKDKGRLVVVTFHSGEDKIVKEFFNSFYKKRNQGSNRYLPEQEKEQPVWSYPVEPGFCFSQISKKPIIVSRSESNRNIRSRSAKLRWGQVESPLRENIENKGGTE